MSPVLQIAARREQIAALEKTLWADPFDRRRLDAYQAAYRELEDSIAMCGNDPRHHIKVVIPVADSPQHLRRCLESLLMLCRCYRYGGQHAGVYRKVSVVLADDSLDTVAIDENRRLADWLTRQGVCVDYFGRDAQLALLARLDGAALDGIIGVHDRTSFAHKGQGMMRNIAYLYLAELQQRHAGESLLFYTVDADQQFCVNVPGVAANDAVYALSYLHRLDALFSAHPIDVLTGKVVGDPPVSPAVMAGNFLEDVIAFVDEMATLQPHHPYRQPAPESVGSGQAAYHDMADMFGFNVRRAPYRYRCGLPGTPSNRECFSDFASHVQRFFYGEHPTRVSWYRYAGAGDDVQAARTVYTGNYAFNSAGLDWFIPFAPLRLRMSGPTMGRLLRAQAGGRFVSANLPMLHRRTHDATRRAEFRPGVVAAAQAIDLGDELERQFFGDVMLFTVERLSADGYPGQHLAATRVDATLKAVCAEMWQRYRAKQQTILAQAETLSRLLHDPGGWWHDAGGTDALARFDAFLAGIAHNFAAHAACQQRIGDEQIQRRWLMRQRAAILGLYADRDAWQQALRRLRGDSGA